MKLGNVDISTVKLGASQVQAIYQGSNLVWQNAPVATAATGIGQTSFTANWEAYTGAVVYLLDVSTSPTFDTFIYENQEVNAPSTSYVVIGLESNTTYYYRVRASDTDLDAQAFFDRVTTAGGTLSTTEQDAVNQLVLDMKADGIWTKMKAIYPMVGASAAACAQNLKSSSFTGTFTSGWTFASTGVTPNGTSAYMDTNFNPLSEFSDKNSVHLSNYFPNFVQSGTCQIGSTDAFGGYYAFWDYPNFQGLLRLADNDNTFINNGFGQSGYNIATRTSSVLSTLYINKITTFTSTSASDTLPNANVYIGARNASGINSPDSNEQSLVTMGDGLTAADADNLYDAVQAFQTTLNRAII